MITYSCGFETKQLDEYCKNPGKTFPTIPENHECELICGHDERDDVHFTIKEPGVYQALFNKNGWELDKLA